MSTAMTVERIQTDHGSHIEPPLDQRWSEFMKLQWQAGVVTVDSGVEVGVTESEYWTNGVRQHGYFDVIVGRWRNHGPYRFHEAWIFMNGVSSGAKAVEG